MGGGFSPNLPGTETVFFAFSQNNLINGRILPMFHGIVKKDITPFNSVLGEESSDESEIS